MDQVKKIVENILYLYKKRKFRDCIEYKNSLFPKDKTKKIKFDLDISLIISFCQLRLGDKTALLDLVSENSYGFEKFIAHSTSVKFWHSEDRVFLLRMLFGYPSMDLHQNIAIFAAPRSGSTFLHQVLVRQMGGLPFNSEARIQRNPFHIDRFRFVHGISSKNTIIKSHAICCDYTKAILNLSDVIPVVLYRNFFDSIESFCFHQSSGYIGSQTGLDKISADKKMKFILAMFAESYLSFYFTWRQYCKNRDALMFSFPDLMENTERTIYKIIQRQFVNFSRQDVIENLKEIRSKMQEEPHQFNFMGDKKENYSLEYFMNKQNREEIIAISSCYPDFDFGDFLDYK